MKKIRSPLEQWLWEKGLLKGRFAELNGLSLKQLRPAIMGDSPSADAAHKIVLGTRGEIDYNTLFDPDGRRRTEAKAKSLI